MNYCSRGWSSNTTGLVNFKKFTFLICSKSDSIPGEKEAGMANSLSVYTRKPSRKDIRSGAAKVSWKVFYFFRAQFEHRALRTKGPTEAPYPALEASYSKRRGDAFCPGVTRLIRSGSQRRMPPWTTVQKLLPCPAQSHGSICQWPCFGCLIKGPNLGKLRDHPMCVYRLVWEVKKPSVVPFRICWETSWNC